MSALTTPSTAAGAERCFREAMTLHQRGDIQAALARLRVCIADYPLFMQAYVVLGTLQAQQGSFADAEATLRVAVKVDASHPTAHHLLAKTLHRQGRLHEAMTSYRAALDRGLRSPEILTECASLLVDLGQLDEAETLLKEALPAGNQAKTLTLLGRVEELRGNLDKAVTLHDRALSLQPDDPHAYVNRGTAKRLRGDGVAALDDFNRALTLKPGLPSAAASRGMTLLSMERFSEGWGDFKARVRARDGERDLSADRAWNGAPLDGKRVLVWTEYGLGDEIMAAGLLPDLIARTAHCTLVCSARIESLLRRSFPGIDVIPFGGAIGGSFDARLPLMDVAAWLRPTLQSFPARQTYLAADAGRTAAFRQRYDAHNTPLIGISWQSSSIGTGPFKSTRLADWTKVLTGPGLRFVSLQYAPSPMEVEAAKSAAGADIVIDAAVDPTRDLEDTVAQINAMDLVITTSNTAVHIAGALGKPTWLIAPEGPGAHWYWFKDRSDSPWYPSVRIFRQSQRGDWTGPLAAVGDELRHWSRP